MRKDLLNPACLVDSATTTFKTLVRTTVTTVKETFKVTSTSEWIRLIIASLTVVVGIRAVQYFGFVTGGTAGISILVEEIGGIEISLSYVVNIFLLMLAVSVGKQKTFVARSALTIILIIFWLRIVPPVNLPLGQFFAAVGLIALIFCAMYAALKMRDSLQDTSEKNVAKIPRIIDLITLPLLSVALIAIFGQSAVATLCTIGLMALLIGIPIGCINSTGATLEKNGGGPKLFESGSASGGSDSLGSALEILFRKKITSMSIMRSFDFGVLSTVFAYTFVEYRSFNMAFERTAFSLVLVLAYGIIAEAFIDRYTKHLREKIIAPNKWLFKRNFAEYDPMFSSRKRFYNSWEYGCKVKPVESARHGAQYGRNSFYHRRICM